MYMNERGKREYFKSYNIVTIRQTTIPSKNATLTLAKCDFMILLDEYGTYNYTHGNVRFSIIDCNRRTLGS